MSQLWSVYREQAGATVPTASRVHVLLHFLECGFCRSGFSRDRLADALCRG